MKSFCVDPVVIFLLHSHTHTHAVIAVQVPATVICSKVVILRFSSVFFFTS